ncbi:hypothetical protein [Brevibacterium sp.]|uniref:Uncharacterized protein n=1 Tax=Brevibacterium antiquum CNRZ 918 TaxID=1255637 RepID=A0A2H1KZX6_9MICO|nr:hypothetical protein [Brevibacterium sp.]MDN6638679.1 hypothetical protein [Yaniella sp.]SMY05316.1 hypothetical protein BANT918_03358 [Brevibacterium antiquum CNRZ 918]HCG57176.1 hypothetical protein [Brevibacterium sp.]
MLTDGCVERTVDKFEFPDVHSGTARQLAEVLDGLDGRFMSELIRDPDKGQEAMLDRDVLQQRALEWVQGSDSGAVVEVAMGSSPASSVIPQNN